MEPTNAPSADRSILASVRTNSAPSQATTTGPGATRRAMSTSPRTSRWMRRSSSRKTTSPQPLPTGGSGTLVPRHVSAHDVKAKSKRRPAGSALSGARLVTQRASELYLEFGRGRFSTTPGAHHTPRANEEPGVVLEEHDVLEPPRAHVDGLLYAYARARARQPFVDGEAQLALRRPQQRPAAGEARRRRRRFGRAQSLERGDGRLERGGGAAFRTVSRRASP